MWNPEQWNRQLIYKAETKAQIWGTNIWRPRAERGLDESGNWG